MIAALLLAALLAAPGSAQPAAPALAPVFRDLNGFIASAFAPDQGRVSGSVNGGEVGLDFYSNAVLGTVGGKEVRLNLFSNAVTGQAHGADLRLEVYANGVFGTAGGKDVRLYVSGRINPWRLIDMLVLNLPAQVLSSVVRR